ncbi:hypothetical protein SYNPS1DRAFT_27701 [Syncephalis pseudoplumigaleata]|uniref:Uncharacterized protein n=1 Tax=Syncephalis pseudoplumigaleata TaxID=1712513 RepID=A0A4P9Z268_9FUNG|nr:hypothetical protein SYNPS1DRAFT_27701 [Syncephalis pseudoplumigaleata]|eukprot:RKP26617.1 hypothetical protein SYNPS1DRAFT_27701 [Syncephalis pseudoplumigaleata]
MASSDLVLLPKFTKAVLGLRATSTPGVDGIIDWDARLSGETFIPDNMSCISAPRSVASADSQPLFNRKRRMSSPSVLTYPSSSASASNAPQPVSPTAATNKFSLRRNASHLRSLRGNRRCHSTHTTASSVLPPSPTRQLPTSYEVNEEDVDSDSSDVSVSDYASTRPASGTERTRASYDNDTSAQSDASSSVPARRWAASSRASTASATSLQSNLEAELSRQIAEQKKLREQLASLQNQLHAERAITRRKMYQDFQEAPAAPVVAAAPAAAEHPMPVPVRRVRKTSVASMGTTYSTDTLVNERMPPMPRTNITSRSAAARSASPPLSPNQHLAHGQSRAMTSSNMVMNGAVYTEVNLPAIPAQRILVRRASQAQLPANGPVQPSASPRPMYRRKMSLPLVIDTANCAPNMQQRVRVSPRQSVRMASPTSPSATGKAVYCVRARPAHPVAAPMPSLVPIKQAEHANPAFSAYRMRKVTRRSTVSNGQHSPRTSDDSDMDLRRIVCQPRSPVHVRREEHAQCMPAGFQHGRRRHSVATHHQPAMIAVRPAMARKMSAADLASQQCDLYMMRPSSPDTSYDESSDFDTSSPLTTPSLSQDSDDSFGYQMRPPQPSAQRKMTERTMGDVLASHHRRSSVAVASNIHHYHHHQEEPEVTSVPLLTSRGAPSRARSNAQAVKASSSAAASASVSRKGKERGVWSRPSVSATSALASSSSAAAASPSSSATPLPCANSLWQSAIGPVSERYTARSSASKILRKSVAFDALYAARAEAPWLFVPSAIDEVDDSVSEVSSISAADSPVYDSTVRMCFTAGMPNSR